MLERKSQTGGDSSINVQSDKDVNLNIGIAYSEARQIALDVFRANFLELSQSAAEIAYARVQEMTDSYLAAIQNKDAKLLKSMEDPDMQYALFTAQKEYARTGDKDLAELLVDILVDRAAQNERSVLKIALNESLSVAPKLTVEQYNVLSLVFLLRYTKRNGIKNIELFTTYLRKCVEPFALNVRSDHACFQHLEYAGCGSEQISTMKIGNLFKSVYPGLFWKGATIDEMGKIVGKDNLPLELFVPCLNNPELVQFNAIDEDVLKKKCEEFNLPTNIVDSLLGFQKSHLFNDEEVESLVVSILPSIKELLGLWNNSFLSRFTLTSVGIAIAHANIRRKLGEEYDLSIWIH